MKIRFTTRCPECANSRLVRLHRKWWMRLIPGTRYYRCSSCDLVIIVLLSSCAIAKEVF
ncbi:hypothetical protein JXA02_07385 [candidate division KSB1 bacterium]|nr:hypothetical protein [candidate division KSB1 bacterium]